MKTKLIFLTLISLITNSYCADMQVEESSENTKYEKGFVVIGRFVPDTKKDGHINIIQTLYEENYLINDEDAKKLKANSVYKFKIEITEQINSELGLFCAKIFSFVEY